MARRRSSLLLALSVVAFSVRGAAAAEETSPAVTVYDRLFEAHRAELVRRAGRPEAVAPLAALVRLEEHLAPEKVEAELRALVEDRRTDPLVGAQAAYHLGLAEARRGDEAVADKRWRALGLLGAFQVVGPFDAQGRSGLARVYPPEEQGADPRRGQRYPGKEREVGWRSAQGAFRQGALSLDALLRPDVDGVAYALTFVRSDRRRQAVVRVGSAGPIKVWVGGRLVLERNAVRVPALDQDAAPVILERGVTPVLVKTVVLASPWRIFLRLTDQAGRALSAVEAAPDGPGPGLPPAGRAQAGVPARSLQALLRTRAERARAAAVGAAWLDYGQLLALTRAEDREAKVTEAVLERAVAAGAGAEALLLLAEVAAEEDDRRRALDRAAHAAGDPGLRALALSGLGEIDRAHRRESAAIGRFREALATDPLCVPAVLALATEERFAGLTSAALARIDGLPATVRALPRVRAARARLLEGLGRRKEAEAELRAVHALRRTDLDLALELARAARNRGAPGEAVRLYEHVGRQRPELTFISLDWARLLEGEGDVAGARRVLEGTAERLPDEPAAHEALGKLLVRAGDLPAGLDHLQKALALRPQNPTLRRYIEHLALETSGGRGEAAADLARSWAEDGERLAREALLGGEGRKERASAVVLLHKQVVRVHRNGLSERFAQRLVQVRTDRAAREQQEFYVRYTPGSQDVEIRRAQVYRKGNGGEIEVSEATGRDDRDLSEPWYGLYYDNRALVVVFEGLRAGDVLEIQYTVADISAENALADYFGDIDFIAETWPRRRWEYVLLGPAGKTFHFNDHSHSKMPRFERQVESRGEEEVVHRFVARDVPRIETEPAMPGWAEVTPYLHVSTYRGWDDVGRWYWHLVEDQLTADDNLRRVAREATLGAHTVEEKVRALHAFVLDSTRYVGLEFGIHGYKPYRVTQVLARRFGDCKDKASLLMALLREVGVASDIVLLRTRRAGRVEPSPASLAVFDHAIVYVPALDLYLDGTAEFSGMAELPYEDQGVMALRVNPRGATWVQTPVLPSSASRASRSWMVDLDREGGARIEELVTITGQSAPEWREHYQTPGERQDRFSKVWNGRLPGAVLEALEMEGIEDRNRPVTVRSVARVPRLAEEAGAGLWHLPVAAREPEFVRSYARLSQRRHELLVAFPWQHEEVLTYRVPQGWQVAALPDARGEHTSFGSFRVEVSADDDGRQVRVQSKIDVIKHRFAPAEYPSFRAFLRALDAALGQKIVLRRDEG
jgi:cellulose synthase operon protein C